MIKMRLWTATMQADRSKNGDDVIADFPTMTNTNRRISNNRIGVNKYVLVLI